MVAQHSEGAQAWAQAGKDLRAGIGVVGGRRIVMARGWALGDKVTGQDYKVRLQLVGGADGRVDDADIHVAVIVKIAELDDAQSVQTGGQALQSDLKAGDLHIRGVAIEGAGADGSQAGNAKDGSSQEL